MVNFYPMGDVVWQNWVVGLAIIIAVFLYGLQPNSINLPALQSPSSSKQPITILLGGDVNMGRKIGQQILSGDIDYPFAKISDTLLDADITFVNLESQLADLGGETQSPTNEYRFAGPPEAAQSLKNAGIDIVSVANNHMWDYGKDRLFETLDSLQKAGVIYVGASSIPENKYGAKIIEVNGKTIAFLAMTTLLNGYENAGATEYVSFDDPDAIISEINRVKENIDYILVSVHTGVEYATKPQPEMVELSHKLIDAGADAIIGHHPHVPQPIEIYNDKPIFYSLGNFAFWQPFSFWTQNGFLAKLSLTKNSHGEGAKVDYQIIPVKSGWQPEVNHNESDIEKLHNLLYSSP